MNLRELDLPFNRLTGPVPPELGMLSNLTKLWLHRNDLTGPVPVQLSGLAELELLALSRNRMSGPIPAELGDLAELTQLWLHSNQLSGPIPAELGNLTDLQFLELQQNQLTGHVPWELGNLSDLRLLHLSGNTLEGCIRPSLRRVPINDLPALGLAYCAEQGRVSAPGGVTVTLAEGTFTIGWSGVAGAARYESQHRVGGSDAEWVSLGEPEQTSAAYSPVGGPACGTVYAFRVRSYGDGVTYAAGWGPESEPVSVTTGACNRAPAFDATAYSFTVAESAAASTPVGTVSATDPDEGDTVSYSITSGNEGGKFAIGEDTGEITVAGALDYETETSYALTVWTSDGNGGADGATVGIEVMDVAETALQRKAS